MDQEKIEELRQALSMVIHAGTHLKNGNLLEIPRDKLLEIIVTQADIAMAILLKSK